MFRLKSFVYFQIFSNMLEFELQPTVHELHQLIHHKDVENILIFIEQNPFEKVVISNGDSAISSSLKCGSLDIYELLVSHGFKLAPEEKFNEILNFFDKNEDVKSEMKQKLRDIHRKYMIESSLKHLYKLNLMSKLAPTTKEGNRRQYDKIIAETFEELNKNPENETLLKYVSTASGESKFSLDMLSAGLSKTLTFRFQLLLRF